MPDIIDIDTGAIIAGEATIEQMGEEILDLVIQVASGEVRTKADRIRRKISSRGNEEFHSEREKHLQTSFVWMARSRSSPAAAAASVGRSR